MLELMVALAIGLVILLALGTAYLGTTQTTRQSDSVARMSEDAAVTFKFLGDYLRMAGFSQPRRFTLPGSGPIINGERVTLPNSNFNGAPVRGCDHGFSDVTKAFDQLQCSAGTSGPAAIAIRFEGDTDNTVPVSGSPSDCLNQSVAATAVSAIPGGVNYALIDSRFLGQAGDGPEFFCAGNGNNYAPQPLTQYVEDIRVRYGVASNSVDREVKYYATAADIDGLGLGINERWGRVVNIQVCLLMRSEKRDQAGNGHYVDCGGGVQQSTDGFARRAFTSTFALRNRTSFLQPS